MELSKWDKKGLRMIVQGRAEHRSGPNYTRREGVFGGVYYPLVDTKTGKELKIDLSEEATKIDLSYPKNIRAVLGIRKR